MLSCQTMMVGESLVERRPSTASNNAQEELDDLLGELLPSKKETNRYSRRKSVFAEQYNPEEDDDEDSEPIVHPKTDEQRQQLTAAIKNILLFRSLEKQQMQEVLDAMFERKVTAGEIIIRQGDDGDYFYVVKSGSYNVYCKGDNGENKHIFTYNDSGSFGELALMYNMPRAATVEATSEGTLWVMSRQIFRRIVLKSAFKKRKEYEALLESVSMLKSLQPYERMNLCDALMPRTYDDGEVIIQQGDGNADCMYFVEEGLVRITIVNSKDEEEVQVSVLGKGQYFGELALVTHKPRAASAYAVGTVRLASLDVNAFERLLGPCMDIMKRNIELYRDQLDQILNSEVCMGEATR